MCLTLSKWGFIPRIALTNIKCYKVLNKTEFANGRILYTTPYQNYEINMGTTYISKLDKKYGGIHEGLHSFKHIKNARIPFRECKNPIVVECLIPVWSIYYKGTFNHVDSYASNKLTYLKIIK